MKKWVQDQLHTKAEEIRDAVRGGMMYGYHIDTDNADMMIVAAYELARSECTHHIGRIFDELASFERIRH